MNVQFLKKNDNEEESNENEYDDGLRDSAYNGIISDIIRKEMEICNDRQMRQPELLMLQSSAKSTISIDKSPNSLSDHQNYGMFLIKLDYILDGVTLIRMLKFMTKWKTR